MLTDEQFTELGSDLESDRVERKESLSGDAKDRIGQAICAYANDLPNRGLSGIIIIGVDDRGNPTGLSITDGLLRDLAGFRSDGNILPLPTLTVEKRSLQGINVAVIEVQPCADPPVRYYGRVWIRIGPRRAIASRDEERILTERRRSATLCFDQHATTGATLDELDLKTFSDVYLPAAFAPEVLQQNVRSLPEQMAALHLCTPDGLPNHAAILLLGLDPRRWLPGAYVQFVRFDGTSLDAAILDQKEMTGPVAELLRRADDLASVNIRVATTIVNQVSERRNPDYPLAAIQQVLRNAVLHRTYEVHSPVYWYWFTDRVEIHSPGGLYGRVNESNFGDPYATDYRNPTLAEGLKLLGFVQRFGVGIQLARKACEENGNPVPEFQFSSAAVLCVLRSAL